MSEINSQAYSKPAAKKKKPVKVELVSEQPYYGVVEPEADEETDYAALKAKVQPGEARLFAVCSIILM